MTALPESEDGGVDGLTYVTARRWRTFLETNSTAFGRLQKERERGWRSPALDAWYARRQTSAATTHSAEAAAATAPAAPTPRQTATRAGHVEGEEVEEGTTTFAAADVAVLAERYRQHARRVMQQAASAFFVAATRGATPPPPPLFLDLGCAPGGVSKYLVEDLRWHGVGVSLASTDGGIEVDPTLLHCGAAPFVLLDGDVTQPPRTWCRSASYRHVGSGDAGRESASAAADALLAPQTPSPPRFHFVNCGAVLDHGQRRRWDKAAAAAAAAAQDSDAQSRALAAADAAPPAAPPILPWFSLLVPQLTTALTHVDDGGAVMLVHGAPHCASLYILLRCMEEVVGAAASSVGPACEVHALETMHLAKPPLYLLWTGVRQSPPGAASTTAEPRTPDARTCLLESLSATSPRVSPVWRASTASGRGAAVAETRSALLREKELLWLGESEEGFQLAVEGFWRYRHLVDAIWSRVEAHLRQRRERAERALGSGAGRERSRRGAGGPVAGNKRTRGGDE